MPLSIRPSSTFSWKSQLLLRILIVMLHLPCVLSFLVLPSTQRTPFAELSQKRIHEYPSTSDSIRSWALFAAKRSGGPGPKSKKKQKNSGAGGAKPKGQQNDKRHSKSASPKKTQKSLASPKKTQSSTPPWQVMSAKEAKKNIELEKERRKLAQQGIHQPTGPTLDISEQSQTKTLSKSFLSESDQRFLKWKRFNPSNTPNLGLRMVGAYLDRRLPPSLGVPEVAFLGRSNVGKSSLLNRLTTASTSASSSTQARVGKTPGATASVNLYALAKYKTTAGSSTTASSSSSNNNNHNAFKDLLGLADLPGFGYAKLSKELQESVQEAAENYLGKRRELALGILLVDVRRAISDNDRAVLAALYDMGVPLLVVATKIDKLKNDVERSRHLQAIQQGLGLPEGQPLAISSVTGEGVKPLWNIILEACETSVWEFRKTYDDSAAAEVENADDQYAPGEASLLDGDDDEEELAYDMGYDWIHGGDFGIYEDDEDGADDFYDSNLDYDENNPPSSDGDWFADEDEYSTNNMMNPNAPRSGETMKSLKQRARDMERRGEV